MDSDEAKKLLEKDRQERAQKCQMGIKELLELYKCRIDVSVILRAGQVIPQVEIVPME